MRRALFVMIALGTASAALAQGTQADYDRALNLRKKYESLIGSVPEAPRWIARTHKAYYRRTVKGGHDFILVDADAKTKAPAFDHAKIASALGSATGKTYTALELPLGCRTRPAPRPGYCSGLSARADNVRGSGSSIGPPTDRPVAGCR